MGDTGRSEDVKMLHNQLSRESDPNRRQTLRHTINKISNESGAVKSMREALVRAHRDGNKSEIKDIHEFVKGKEKYGQ